MHSYAEQLRAAGVACFPCWARYNSDKGRYDKGPAVPRGESWQAAAHRPYDDPALNWSSGIIGVPIPAGVVVFDLDTYKGVTREAVEQWLGVPLNWGQAALQRTIGGGEHYAFKCDWPVKQGDSIGVPGFDTRAAGKGFICSGEGYAPLGAAGLFALSQPACLPELPDAARPQLEHVAPAPTQRTDVPTDSTPDEIVQALRHIDPGCSRAEWVRIGMALRHQFEDDLATGLTLFDQWSSGEFWEDGAPENYVSEHIEHQWGSFKAEGGTTIATLFYRAIQGGWRPPATFDTSLAFGSGGSADGDTFDRLVERIRREGCDIKATGSIVDEIKAAGCDPLQVALLAAELKTELAQSGLKDRKVAAHIDQLLKTQPAHAPQAPGMYGKSDPENAELFLGRFYPNGTLVRCDGEFYGYTGKIWERRTADTVKHQVAVDMCAQRMQENKISACFRMVSNVSPVLDGKLNDVPTSLVFFDNGMLDLTTGQLHPHDKQFFTTNLLPYAWNPSASCHQWLHFLNDVFNGDQERVALIQEWFGYMLVRDYSYQKIMVLLGGPRCGKGTIGRVLAALVGDDNFSGGHLSAFANDAFLASLRSKTVVFIGDAAKRIPSAKVNEVTERLKSISGNDEVSFDRKFLSTLSEALPTRITLAANNVPRLFDDSGALASRLLLITFDKSYLGNEDLTLGDRLLTEVSGIAAWAMQGWARLQQQGRFTEPQASREEIDYIKETYSPLVQFLQSECELNYDGKITSADLYNTYRAWCLAEGEDLMRRKTFISAFKDATRGKGVRYGTQRDGDNVFKGFSGVRVRGEIPTTAGAFKPQVVK